MRAVLLLAAFLAGRAACTPLQAQDLTRAVLESGPVPVKGIPVYPPNRISAHRGLYSLEIAGTEQAAADRSLLEVLFSREQLFIPREWIPRPCGGWNFYQVADDESFTLCYADERGFYLFFFFPGSGEPGYWCAVAGPFVERFLFLLNFAEDEAEAPFPAIVQARP